MPTFDTIGNLEKLVLALLDTYQKGNNTTSFWNTNLAPPIEQMSYPEDLIMKDPTQ